MSEQLSEVEQKMIEFATKAAETIQSQAGQIQALSHVLMIALVSLSEQDREFRDDFLARVGQVRDQLDDHVIDNFTREYFDEMARFLEDPANYSAENRPKWFRGIIYGGKETDTPDRS